MNRICLVLKATFVNVGDKVGDNYDQGSWGSTVWFSSIVIGCSLANCWCREETFTKSNCYYYYYYSSNKSHRVEKERGEKALTCWNSVWLIEILWKCVKLSLQSSK